MSKTHETPCNDNWLLLLIPFTNIFALFVALITLLESVGNLNLVYISIYIYICVIFENRPKTKFTSSKQWNLKNLLEICAEFDLKVYILFHIK